jgi:hypothetical protein
MPQKILYGHPVSIDIKQLGGHSVPQPMTKYFLTNRLRANKGTLVQ